MLRSPTARMILRILLVADGILLLAVGGLCLWFFDGTSGKVVGGVVLAGAVTMFGLVPLTDPERAERRRARPVSGPPGSMWSP